MGNEKKEQIALSIGFVLILIVIIITLFRSDVFSTADQSSSYSSDSELSDGSNNFETISSKELQKKLIINSEKEKLSLLDVRPFESYAAEHIIDSVNIPLDEFPAGSKINAHSKIIVIGSSIDDKDVATAVEKLKEEKIENVAILFGGMETWKESSGTTVTYGNPESFVDQSKVSYVDPEKLNEAIESKVPVYVVDVRTKEEYEKGHVTGAVNVPFEELEKRRSDIKEKRVVVVGINELQEFQAAVQMYDMLLVSPYVMRGGMPKWQEKGFRTEN